MRKLLSAPFRRHGYAHLFVAVALVFIVIHPPFAQAGSEQVKGVNNFGRVTDLYFRGGEVTNEGVRRLHDMGVRTIIDLTGDRDEEAAARRLGMKFYSFPMDGGERPDDAKVAAILKIITEAEEPVYAHCKGGRHRAGTIAALYRIRVQGWTPEKAWKEQQSYGFGSVSDHRQLYAYVYGADRDSSRAKTKSDGKHDRKKHDHDDDDDDDDD
jgi:tyrosine-protein phosphatase SIW14